MQWMFWGLCRCISCFCNNATREESHVCGACGKGEHRGFQFDKNIQKTEGYQKLFNLGLINHPN